MSRARSVIVVCVLFSLVNFVLIGLWLSRQYVVPIMMYHNVEDFGEARANAVSPKNFEWQMAYLKSNGYNVLSFDEYIALKEKYGNKPLPRKSVMITFDDAYADNYTNAFAILKKYGYPATIFAPTELIDSDGYLTWDQMREMAQQGITFGSHTLHHAYLPDLPYEQQRDEIISSKARLHGELGKEADYFSYPIGGFSDSIKKMVQEAGYTAAVATNRGYDRLNRDVFELNRIRFSDKDDRKDYMWIKLSGFYNLFREPKDPF